MRGIVVFARPGASDGISGFTRRRPARPEQRPDRESGSQTACPNAGPEGTLGSCAGRAPLRGGDPFPYALVA